MRSMYCLTNSLVKKWRLTSSIRPRLLDELFSEEVAADVEHQAAPGEAGVVDDVDAGHGEGGVAARLAFDFRRKELEQRLDAVEQARRRWGLDAYAARGDRQFVALGMGGGSRLCA